ncbi:MAG: PLP-dependent aminotransferase family protein [Desulfuromonadales bacterium]|nr:PLP-dependent aminotransferase family protein [Desulfuromonadales bacterium]
MPLTHQTGQFVQSQTDQSCIRLELGQPSPQLLPLEKISVAATAMFHHEQDPLLLQYGAVTGHLGFRRQLAGFLQRQLGREVRPERLMATGGNSQALSMVAQLLANCGDTVVVEDPSYFLVQKIFSDAGLRIESVAVDEQGLVVDQFEESLHGGSRPRLLYLIPNHQNPTGCCLSQARALRLLQLADEFDFTIVCDNPYALLWYGEAVRDCFGQEIGRHPRLLDLGSFSKILAPGLRLGWIEASEEMIARLSAFGVARSGGAINPPSSVIVERLLDSGAQEEHLLLLRQTLSKRKATLCEKLRNSLPDLKFSEPQGGYFVWLDLGEGVNALKLQERAVELGVSFMPGERCALTIDARCFARLSFAFYRENELEMAVERFQKLF